MGKYGKGLAKEFAIAVLNREVSEVFSIYDVRKFAFDRSWNLPDSYINEVLSNSSSMTHSLKYPKYFKSIGNGEYVLADDVRSLL